MKSIEPETPAKYLSKAGAYEINSIRPCIPNAYGVVERFDKVAQMADGINRQ